MRTAREERKWCFQEQAGEGQQGGEGACTWEEVNGLSDKKENTTPLGEEQRPPINRRCHH